MSRVLPLVSKSETRSSSIIDEVIKPHQISLHQQYKQGRARSSCFRSPRAPELATGAEGGAPADVELGEVGRRAGVDDCRHSGRARDHHPEVERGPAQWPIRRTSGQATSHSPILRTCRESVAGDPASRTRAYLAALRLGKAPYRAI